MTPCQITPIGAARTARSSLNHHHYPLHAIAVLDRYPEIEINQNTLGFYIGTKFTALIYSSTSVMFQEQLASLTAGQTSLSRGFLKPPGAPRMLPVLLPDLSLPSTFDEGRVGSPEFRDAVTIAKQQRLARQVRMQGFSVETSPSMISTPPPFKRRESGMESAKRMQTRVAVVEPHHFQVVPLREIKKRSVPVIPDPPNASPRFVRKPRNENSTPSRPESRIGTSAFSKVSKVQTILIVY